MQVGVGDIYILKKTRHTVVKPFKVKILNVVYYQPPALIKSSIYYYDMEGDRRGLLGNDEESFFTLFERVE